MARKTSIWTLTLLLSFMIEIVHGHYLYVQSSLELFNLQLIVTQAGCNQQIPTAPAVASVAIPVTTLALKTTVAPLRPPLPTITAVVYVTYNPPSSPFSVGPGGVEIGEVEERALEVRDSAVIPPPWILSLIGTVTLSQICTCVLGGISGPPTTVYGPSYSYATVGFETQKCCSREKLTFSQSTPTVTKTFTAYTTTTSLIASGTIWSSVH
jgi:hypothetical protein